MDITTIIEGLFSLIIVILTGFIVPVIKNRLQDDKIDNIVKWIDIAVASAEQIYESGLGSSKKQYVIEFLQKHNLYFDEDKIDKMIESAVYKLKNTKGETQ